MKKDDKIFIINLWLNDFQCLYQEEGSEWQRMNFLSLLINIAFLNPFPNEALCYKIEDHEGKVMEHAVLLHVQAVQYGLHYV